MRFGLIHRLMTDAMAVLGLLALISSGQLATWVSVAILVSLALALGVPDGFKERLLTRQLSVLLPLGLFGVELTRLSLGGPVIELAVEFAAALQVIRLATRRGAAHDQQVIVLALLHLVAGTVLGGGLAYGLCFLGFLVVAPGALVLSHLRREVEGNYRQGARDRTGLPVDVPRILRSRRVIGRSFLGFTCLLSVPIFLFTAVLFVLFPRVGLSLLLLNQGNPARMVGFSDRVDLGGVGRLRSDPTIAMRVEYPGLGDDPPPRLALYLRGTGFDTYDGRAWSRSIQPPRHPTQYGADVIVTRPANRKRDLCLKIELEPIEPRVVFLPQDTVALSLPSAAVPRIGHQPTVTAGPEGEFRYRSPDERGLLYHAFIGGRAGPALALMPEDRARYLTLPRDIGERVATLARRWVRGKHDSLAQAQAIESRLRTEYRYDLDSPSGNAGNPLEHFLFESRRGHCEFYSTAMAVLLRTLGIPARNVTGFIGGTYNRFGAYYAVRQGDAHSWVEVFVDGLGWTRFDPTPPANAVPQSEINGALAFVRDLLEAAAQRWNRNVVGYDLKQQVDLFRSVRKRYGDVNFGPSWFGDVFRSPRRTLLLVLGVACVIGGLVWLRRGRRGGAAKADSRSERERYALKVVALYRTLEAALMARGVARPPSTPPLAHARALEQAGHPAGAEAVKLTKIYLEVRFGGRKLSESLRSEFAARVERLRHGREEPNDRRAA
ncbi:MAG TPA: transglutaminaseTgpA domain-containing protein [Polyangiaceae bacterium]